MLKRAKKEKYLKICPKCKSIDIVPDKSTLQQMGVLPQNYICKKCGHSGFVFPEVAISELKDFKDEVDKKHLRNIKKDKSELVDTSDGSFQVRFWWKIAGPALVALGLLSLWRADIILGAVLLAMGVLMFYIIYFKKRKLR